MNGWGKVRELREAAGYPVRELARRSGINASLISGYELHGKEPQSLNALRLAVALGCSVEDVIGRETVEAIREQVARNAETAVWKRQRTSKRLCDVLAENERLKAELAALQEARA